MNSNGVAQPVRRADSQSLADEARSWKSAYVHIPFCRRQCPYCDFAIVDESDGASHDHAQYVDAVVAEIAMDPGIGVLNAINFGGGTPSRLDPHHIGRIVSALADAYGLATDVEISIEVNPEDWSDAFGSELVEAGVTRVSVGAQSLDDRLLGELGRMHHASQVGDVVSSARACGVRSISVDLIFGHPAETDASWAATVQHALALPIDHVSTYALTVEPGTPLSRSVLAGAAAPDDDVQASRYHLFLRSAEAAGLRRYEVSNHARDGHACRYNLSTWAHGEYLGFGMAAHDHRWGIRSRNHRRLDRYLEDVESGVRPRLGTEALDDLAQERDRLMLGVRLAAGIDLTPLTTAFIASVGGQRLLDAGVMNVVADRLVVPDPMLADAVAREALSVSLSDC